MKNSIYALLTFFVFGASALFSQWISNPGINTQLCNASGNQLQPVVVSDNAGGIITAWIDQRNAGSDKIYVQRYNSSGTAMWQANGVALSANQQFASELLAIPDGSGGAIICWKETRSGSVAMYYCRKINSSGAPQWTSDISATEPYNSANDDEMGRIASDENGGILLTYKRYNNSVSKFEIHAQNISHDGTRNYGSNGSVVATSNLSIYFDNPQICVGQAGTSVIVYQRVQRIFAQSLNSIGVKQWGSEGFDAYAGTVGNMFLPKICPDGVGGAIITNIDQRIPSNNFDIYAQRVKNGSSQWGALGKPIGVGAERQWQQQITYDQNYGAYIAWSDDRNVDGRPYIQRIDLAGNSYFQANGIRVNPDPCGLVSISCGDSNSVYIVTATATAFPNIFLFAQKLSSLGAFPWGINHIPVSSFLSPKSLSLNPSVVESSGSLVCVWEDSRNSPNITLYGHKIQPSGVTGINNNNSNPSEFKLEQNYPNPFNPATKISFSIPKNDFVSLMVYDINGKLAAVLVNEIKTAGSHYIEFNESTLSSGTYFYRIQTSSYSETKKMMLIK
jgi:hypothetical protein